MARLRLFLVSALFVSCLALGQGDTIGDTVTIKTDAAASAQTPDSSELTKLTTEPTTAGSESTSSKPSTTTASPETTTPTPTTTTPKPTTTTPKPTTTTTKPTTTTTKPTTTTVAPSPAPGPVPPAEQGTWFYSENNVTCVVVQFAAQFNVTYTNTTGNSVHKLVNVPKYAIVNGGSCLNNSQWLQISWPNTTLDNSLVLDFHLNTTTQQYELRYLNVTLIAKQFPGAAASNATMELSHASPEWSTSVKSSYRCTPPSTLTLSGKDNLVATLTLQKLQEEAFRTKSGTGFSAGRECAGGDVPDTVPIVVGCALAGLVVAVLVAYLVSRRRSAASGYLSM